MSKLDDFLAKVEKRCEKVKEVPTTIEGYQDRLFLYVRSPTDTEALLKMVRYCLGQYTLGPPGSLLRELSALVPPSFAQATEGREVKRP